MKKQSNALFVCQKGFSPQALLVAVTPYLNREVYALETKRRRNGKTAVYLCIREDKTSVKVGPDLLWRETLCRRLLDEANKRNQIINQQLMGQIERNDQIQRKNNELESRSRNHDRLLDLLNFLANMDPPNNPVRIILDFAASNGWVVKANATPRKELPQNGKL